MSVGLEEYTKDQWSTFEVHEPEKRQNRAHRSTRPDFRCMKIGWCRIDIKQMHWKTLSKVPLVASETQEILNTGNTKRSFKQALYTSCAQTEALRVSVAVLAEIPLRSPQKLIIFIIKK